MIRLAPPHPATLPEEVLLRSCTLGRGSSSGPGGQHRNKVQTLVELTHDPTGIAAHAGERRSASQNKAVALFRLRLALATRCRCPVPIGEVRSALWMTRCPPRSAGRISCNPDHRDYPALLAEALDVLDASAQDPRRAAARLMTTPSQLIKLIAEHPPALAALNAARHELGQHALHAPG